MNKTEHTARSRPILRCLVIKEDLWEQAKGLACKDGRSVSSYIREVLKKQCEKEKRKDLTKSKNHPSF